MKAERVTRIFVLWLILGDVLMAALAFALAYFLRRAFPFPDPAQEMGTFGEYVPMLFVHVSSLLGVFFFAQLYSLARASRVDEFSAIVVAVTVGTLMGVALTSLSLRSFVVGQDYSRVMIAYAWVLSILLVTFGRVINSWVRKRLIQRGWGRRRVLIVGTGDVARMILQKLLWTPELGYDAVGIVEMHEGQSSALLGVPVVGVASRLGEIIDQQQADEVIIALPEETSHHDILLSLIHISEPTRPY